MKEMLIRLLAGLLGSMTPMLRQSIVSWLDDMEQRASETPNPFDDLFVAALRALLGLPSTKTESPEATE